MRGSTLDLLELIVIFFAFSVISIISLYLMTEFNAGVQGMFTSNVSYDVLNQTVDTMKGFDAAGVFVFFGIATGIIISAFLIKSHPVFFVISIFVLAFVIVVAAQISNVFIEFGRADEIIASANEFSLTIQIFNNLPTIIMVLGIIVSIVMYAKMRYGSDEYY
jgi:hypothetical protein